MKSRSGNVSRVTCHLSQYIDSDILDDIVSFLQNTLVRVCILSAFLPSLTYDESYAVMKGTVALAFTWT